MKEAARGSRRGQAWTNRIDPQGLEGWPAALGPRVASMLDLYGESTGWARKYTQYTEEKSLNSRNQS